MTIYRIEKKENYVVLDKGFLHDRELSWQAKGLLAFMLSMPNDWVFNMKDLQNRSKNGRDATYRIMKELIEAGYVTRVENRDGGKFGKVEYVVHEVKQSPHTESPDTVPPCTENPYPGNPYPGNPYPENPPLLNNNNTNYKNTNNDDDNKDRPKTNSLNAFRFYEENFQPTLSSVDIEILNYWLDRFPEEIVLCAMRKALEQNVRRIKYIDRILANWEMQKVQTLEDVARLDRQYELEKQARQKRGGVVNGSVHQHRGSNDRSTKEDERISHYEPGKWDDVDISLDGLL
ncbi:phage replication protein [Geobacillus phage GBSV1]|uniref:Phage replication protein n=1 Tax=Geobacillus phage GBSV1 TaxID=365048 RepID=Q0H278_9CAUD|nr:DnaD domain protein [Geobacillus phage GBSV1]ABC61259.1 phage replication protein [Geobacillus phage GBSV1]